MVTMKTLNGYGFNATELNGIAASGYLQKTDTAADSSKLGGQLPAFYATAEEVSILKGDIGDAWVSGKTYAVGDYCISGNQLYKCKTAHTSGSAFNSDYWGAVSVATEIVAIRSEIEHYGRYHSESSNTQNAVFTRVKIGSRAPALFVGNGNGTPIYGYCALFKNNDTECAITGTSGLAITCKDNGDGTAVVSISGVQKWGNYCLIVFYK